MDKNQSLGNRLKNDKPFRKKVVKIAVGVAVTVACGYGVVKNWEHLSDFVADFMQHQPLLEDVVPEATMRILPELTGEKFTATELGSMVSLSAQAINKKIVKAGLATKLGDGSYALTELGRQFGERIIKANSHWLGPNIEWDKSVFDLIFTPDELANGLAEKARQDLLMSA